MHYGPHSNDLLLFDEIGLSQFVDFSQDSFWIRGDFFDAEMGVNVFIVGLI